MKIKAEIMSQDQMRRALKRMSHEILERNSGAKNIVLIGILKRGKPLAETIRDNILQIEGVEVPVAELDVSSFRDDISEMVVRKDYLQPALDIESKDIVLVDDVIYTGRTIRAALDACLSTGRAHSIQLAVLIDRGHRELPIRPDFVGKNVPTSKTERVNVMTLKTDGADCVQLVEN